MSVVTVNKIIEPVVQKFILSDNDTADLSKKIKAIIEFQSQNLPSQIAFSNLMGKLLNSGLDLMNHNEPRENIRYKLAGLIIFDCLLDINDEIMPERRIEIANHICKVLENDKQSLTVNEPVLRTAAVAIGHFARVATTVEAEFLQNFYFPLSLKLIGSVRSESHRFSGALILTQLAINSPALIFSKRKTLFSVLWDVVSDKSSTVRSAAATSLESSLAVISQRESMVDYVKSALRQLDSGLSSVNAEKIIGSLTILDTVVRNTAANTSDLHNIVRQHGTQVHDIIWKVLQKKDWKDSEVRLKVLDIIPNLALAFGNAFIQPNSVTQPLNFLAFTIKHLVSVVNSKKDRSCAFICLTRLTTAMSTHFRTASNVSDVFELILSGFQEAFCVEALNSLSVFIGISLAARKLVDHSCIEFMFRGGLLPELIDSLKIVLRLVPMVRPYTQTLLRGQIISALSAHPVCIDESRAARPVSIRATGPIKESRGYLWNSSAGIFGNSRNVDNLEISGNFRTDVAITFALKILAIPEFFPKIFRDRVGGEDDFSLSLLWIIRDYAIRYTDDFSAEIRKAAVQACAAAVDVMVSAVSTDSEEAAILLQIMNRLLILGVGDDSVEVRKSIFHSITSSMDQLVSMADNVYCLIEALNDGSIEVRVNAMTVLARVAHYDTLHVLPVVRLTLKRLIYTLNYSSDHVAKQECVQILQALVRGLDTLIVPYVHQIIGPLMTLLSDPATEVVVSALSTVGELAFASPASVREHLDDLAPRMIEALNDRSSIVKQETAVIAVGKLVSTLSMVTDEPYKKYSGLFEGLVRAVQNVDESSSELRLQAIKTLGLLGVVDGGVYQRHLATLNPMLSAFASIVEQKEYLPDDDITPETNTDKTLTKMERHYYSVVVRELLSVVRDSSLSHHHQTAVISVMKIVKTIGPSAMSEMDIIIGGFLFRLYQTDSGNNIKDLLLDNIVTLIQVMQSNARRFISVFIKLIKDFFDSHMQLCLDIFEALGYSLHHAEFLQVIQQILPLFLKIVDDIDLIMSDSLLSVVFNEDSGNVILAQNPSTKRIPTADPMRVNRVLLKIATMSDVLGEYRRALIPFVIKIMSSPQSSEVRRQALSTVIHMTRDDILPEYAARIVQSILQMLTIQDSGLGNAIISSLSVLLCRLGTGYIPFVVPVRRKLKSLGQSDPLFKFSKQEEYESLVNRLLKQRALPAEPTDISDITLKIDDRIRNRAATCRLQNDVNFQINTSTLETAWALADKRNATNLIEWMRRLTIELIRQSPSLIIRNCSTLAKAHRPLAEELFHSSFYCIWEELFSYQVSDVVVENSLVAGIELALSSSQIPKSMLPSLLNLAEFMDAQDRSLPIDIRLLAQQTQVANMFAKCLRYREMEFDSKNVPPSFECIDALISVNNQLGLSDRAVGVLRFLRLAYPDIEIQPQWLEKLCRWDDAYKAYEVDIKTCREQFKDDSPVHHDRWLQSELGRLRCLHALGEFEELESKAKTLRDLIKTSDEVQEYANRNTSLEIQRLGANASWVLGKWTSMEDFLEGDAARAAETKDVVLEQNLSFYSAVLAIHNQDYAHASSLIAETRSSLSSSISSLLSESYSRAHRAMVTMQVLAELEEVIEFRQVVEKFNVDLEVLKGGSIDVKSLSTIGSESKLPDKNNNSNVELSSKKAELLRKWRTRLKRAPKDVEVYRQILAVHTLVAEPTEDLDSWLELVSLCRKEGMHSLCANILRQLGAPLPLKRSLLHLASDGTSHVANHDSSAKANDRVLFSTFQYWWSNGEKQRALAELTAFLKQCAQAVPSPSNRESIMFRVRCLLRRATWMRELEEGDVREILETLREARDLAENEYSVWHAWAVANYDQLKRADAKESKLTTDEEVAMTPPAFISPVLASGRPKHDTPSSHHRMSNKLSSYSTPKKLGNAGTNGAASMFSFMSVAQADKVAPFVVEAIRGFVRSIVLGQGQPVANLLQDTLRLITLWFSYGSKKGVLQVLETELDKVSPDNWLAVIPQLIARIHIKSPEISILLRKLLVKVAAAHPQVLVCPISVALNTNDNQQKVGASEVLAELRKNRKDLVEDATLFSSELMRVAITPHELWYDGLEHAAQCYMDNKDMPSMMSALLELHDTLNDNPKQPSSTFQKTDGFTENLSTIGNATLRDISFRQSYGKSLQDALQWLTLFRANGRIVDLHQAWEIYQAVFKKIKVQIGSLNKLELHHVSPALTVAQNLSLSVPGTYRPGFKDVCINSFSPTVHVISSKQRPRRMLIVGSDGLKYQFLLKGHEDLRQDERVMQLFGLINVCLQNDRVTNEKGLNIVRYSVLPLSNNSGVIGWVENCDTINQLIKQYRESKDIRLLIEMKLLQSKCMNNDKLPLMHKVDLFRQVLEETSGEDLAKMLWLKSKTSDVWIERRASFTRSIAVMSMVGYILGLGDRHPSNLMLHQISGQVVHIDFGDCFEITAHRSKYPEIIPFRLTRMLTKCMHSAGIQGTYRITSERVMRVLRENRDSVMAMLEAFVYDPLISWRLLADRNKAALSSVTRVNSENDSPQSKSPVDKLREQASSSLKISSSTEFLSSEQPVDFSPSRISSSIRDNAGVRRSKSKELQGGVLSPADEPLQNNLNARALEVINRIQAKLSGRDFLKLDDDESDDFSVEEQVDRLIKEATSIENLCQLFAGWCPLW